MADQELPVPVDSLLLRRSRAGRRRSEPRYQCGLAMPGRIVLGADATLRAWVQNLATGGTGLLLERPVETGIDVVVVLRSTAEDRVFELPARVIHATLQMSGDWLIGCQFFAKLSADDLDALL